MLLPKCSNAQISLEVYSVAFQELSELAISTYKHIGRIRSARFVGVDLGRFYLELNQVRLSTYFVDRLFSDKGGSGPWFRFLKL